MSKDGRFISLKKRHSRVNMSRNQPPYSCKDLARVSMRQAWLKVGTMQPQWCGGHENKKQRNLATSCFHLCSDHLQENAIATWPAGSLNRDQQNVWFSQDWTPLSYLSRPISVRLHHRGQPLDIRYYVPARLCLHIPPRHKSYSLGQYPDLTGGQIHLQYIFSQPAPMLSYLLPLPSSSSPQWLAASWKRLIHSELWWL